MTKENLKKKNKKGKSAGLWRLRVPRTARDLKKIQTFEARVRSLRRKIGSRGKKMGTVLTKY